MARIASLLLASAAAAAAPAAAHALTLTDAAYSSVSLGVYGGGSAFGGGVAAADGTLYVTTGFGQGVLVHDGSFSPLAGLSDTALGAALVGSTLYVGTGSGVQTVDVTTGTVGDLSATGIVNGVTGAGGSLVSVNADGEASWHDLGTGMLLSGVDLGQGALSGVATGLGGDLFALAHNSGQLLRFDESGVLEAWSLGAMFSYDGLAINPVDGTIYLAGGTGLSTYDVATSTRTQIGTFDFNGGYYPTPMFVSPDGGTLYLGEQTGGGYELHAIATGVSAVPLPAPLALLAAGIGALGLAGRRRG